MNATTLQYDRRDCERTQSQIDDWEAERMSLETLLAHAATDSEWDRIAMAIDQCSDAIGQLKNRLYDVGGGEWR